jgi:hypothetical protein
MKVFTYSNIPTSVCAELKDRLIKAGFLNEVVEITPLPINHEGKRGELIWYCSKIITSSYSDLFH